MSLKVGELVGILKLDTTQYDTALNEAGKKLDKAGKSMTLTEGLASKLGVSARSMSTGLYAVGGTLTGVGLAAFNANNNINALMADVETLMPGNTDRVQELKAGVQSLAIETGKATSDIAGGLYQVVSAFGDTADSMQILEINAKAAKAGVAQTTDAINLTSAVTKAYGDTSAEAVEHVSDLAFQAVKLGQTTFPELAGAIGRVTPLAKELGVTQEELFGVFATFTGVTGQASEVSTQLRGALQALLAPTKDLEDLFGELGYESGKQMLAQLGLKDSLQLVAQAAERNGVPLQKYIGQVEGMTLVLASSGAQSDTFASKLNAMSSAAGASKEAFEAKTQGINKFGEAIEKAKIAAGVFLEKVGTFAPLLVAAGNVALVTASLGSMGVKVSSLITILGGLQKAMLFMVSPAGLGIIAAGIAIWGIIQRIDMWKESNRELTHSMTEQERTVAGLTAELVKLGDAYDAAAEKKLRMALSTTEQDRNEQDVVIQQMLSKVPQYQDNPQLRDKVLRELRARAEQGTLTTSNLPGRAQEWLTREQKKTLVDAVQQSENLWKRLEAGRKQLQEINKRQAEDEAQSAKRAQEAAAAATTQTQAAETRAQVEERLAGIEANARQAELAGDKQKAQTLEIEARYQRELSQLADKQREGENIDQRLKLAELEKQAALATINKKTEAPATQVMPTAAALPAAAQLAATGPAAQVALAGPTAATAQQALPPGALENAKNKATAGWRESLKKIDELIPDSGLRDRFQQQAASGDIPSEGQLKAFGVTTEVIQYFKQMVAEMQKLVQLQKQIANPVTQ